MGTHRIDSPFETPPSAVMGMRRPRPSAADIASVCSRLELQWGLDLHERDVQRVGDGIVRRMTRLGIRSSDQYLLRLDDTEIEALTNLTTVGESWFFRDPGQMRLLQHLLLPRLVQARRSDRRLRIWSAGCSTGQEPWSLAMLLLEVLPNPAGWHIKILGTDIDTNALAVAETGRYGGWALRGLSQASRSRYFVRRGEDWEVGDALRALVRFRRDNLTARDAPPIGDADLVLCRNVLIYLKRDLLAAVVSRIGAALHNGGMLIAGHCELIDVASEGFEVERFPESLVYRREDITGAAASLSASARPVSGQKPKPRPVASLNGQKSARREHSQQRQSDRALDRPRGIHGSHPDAATPDVATAEALMQRAEGAAEHGDYAGARQAAERARQLVPLDYRPRYLLAQIAELEDDSATAQRWLASVLYLVPDFIPAYLDAAALCDRLQKSERASRYRRAARGLLDHLPSSEPLPPPYQHLQAATLRSYLDELLGESEAEEMIALDAEDD